jgi:hypothetical protein
MRDRVEIGSPWTVVANAAERGGNLGDTARTHGLMCDPPTRLRIELRRRSVSKKRIDVEVSKTRLHGPTHTAGHASKARSADVDERGGRALASTEALGAGRQGKASQRERQALGTRCGVQAEPKREAAGLLATQKVLPPSES